MKRFVYWLVERLLRLVGERFEPLHGYPTFYACVIDRESVAHVSTNHFRARALVIEETERARDPLTLLKNGQSEVRLVTYRAVRAERVKGADRVDEDMDSLTRDFGSDKFMKDFFKK